VCISPRYSNLPVPPPRQVFCEHTCGWAPRWPTVAVGHGSREEPDMSSSENRQHDPSAAAHPSQGGTFPPVANHNETATPPEPVLGEGIPAAFSSRGRTRTYDKPVNSRLLYQLSYAGMTDRKANRG
jgi:hypothetical protein